MGQPDLATKGLTSHPDVAADIVNVFVYQGKQIVREKDLRPYVTSESIVSTEGKLKGLSRDNCMENIRDGMRYAIFGFENQEDIDYTMPLRIMGYDYSVYVRQVEEIIAKNKENGQRAWSHKLIEGQKIKPVITFVLFYKSGDDESEMPKSLLQMIDLPRDTQIQKYIRNYEMNLINLRELSVEQIESFQSDFGCIAKYMNKYYNKRQLIDELQNEKMILTHPKDTLYTLAALTKDKRYLAVGETIKEGTSKMCEIADALEKIGYDKGMNVGIETGEYRKLVLLTCRKIKKGCSVEQIADMLEEETEVIQKIYDVAVCYAPDYDVEKIFNDLNC